MEFDHIGVFVKTLEDGRKELKNLIPIVQIGEEIHDSLLKVSVQFLYDNSGVCYEIVAPNGVGNPVDSILAAKRNILNHVAYKVIDFDLQIDILRRSRCLPLGTPQPALAYNGKRVSFFLTPLRIIIEIIEK